jgi:hypothetical protein
LHPQDQGDLFPAALDCVPSLDGLVVAGNSSIELLKPDIVIFIFGNDKGRRETGVERPAEAAKTKRLLKRPFRHNRGPGYFRIHF